MKRENLERRSTVECVWQTYLGGTFKKCMIRKDQEASQEWRTWTPRPLLFSWKLTQNGGSYEFYRENYIFKSFFLNSFLLSFWWSFIVTLSLLTRIRELLCLLWAQGWRHNIPGLPASARGQSSRERELGGSCLWSSGKSQVTPVIQLSLSAEPFLPGISLEVWNFIIESKIIIHWL
jgi:hypothetical protein